MWSCFFVLPSYIDGEVERSHAGASALGLRTWQTPDQGSPIIKQVTHDTFSGCLKLSNNIMSIGG